MPELPEVETTRLGIAPYLEGKRIERVIVRDPRLRWPVPGRLPAALQGARVDRVERRAKYLLVFTDRGCAIVHLGMSGSLRITPADDPPQPHDHVDLVLEGGRCVRFRDPRRFGSLLFTRGDPAKHALIRDLGVEPLHADFSGPFLAAACRKRKAPIKSLLMNAKVVVGVGNIYANESLFLAGIHPGRAAGRISAPRLDRLALAAKEVLVAAISKGGTTLRDFQSGAGVPGYFRTELHVYDREGEACTACGAGIRKVVLGQRATYYCPRCQR